MTSLFSSFVLPNFRFMSDFGFSVEIVKSDMVKYRKMDIVADVYYSPLSYEIGFQVSRDSYSFSIGEIIRLSDQELGSRYRDYAATESDSILSGVIRLSELVLTYGKRILTGDKEVFLQLYWQRKVSVEDYAADVLADQVRPKAEEEFRKGSFKSAADLYKSIERVLSPVEIKKMHYALRHSQL